MRAVPLGIHLGPLYFHLYGLGLAIAAYVAFEYATRRLRRRGIDVTLFGRFVAAVLIAALLGARLANVATNWSYYRGHPLQWFAVWNGGLASFGGIALAIPVALWVKRRWWPDVATSTFSDALIPALVAGWALGRVLGPQFMVAGGGHLTHQWFGIYYHGQVGKRIPVPLIQGAEDALLWCGLVALERRRSSIHAGILSATAMIIWGLVRAADEHWLLGQESHAGSLGVQIAGCALALGGVIVALRSRTASQE